MIRSLNYTKRRRIRRQDVSVRLVEVKGRPLRFEADLNLAPYKLPPDASVFVEAYRQTVYMRFPFGTAGRVAKPENRDLTDFGGSDAVLFRVKVVDETASKGLLLAEADQIRPLTPEEERQTRIGLLRIRSAELADQVWRVDFPPDMPVLLINNRVKDRDSLALSDSFISQVYPAVLRQVLTQALVINREGFDPENDEDWRTLWVRFAESLPGMGEAPVEQLDEPDVQTEWIEDSVAAFCKGQDTFTRFLKSQGLQPEAS